MKTIDEINSYLIKRDNVKTIKYEPRSDNNQPAVFYNGPDRATIRFIIYNDFRVVFSGLRFDENSTKRKQVKEVARDLFDCNLLPKNEWKGGSLNLTDEQKLEFMLLYFS